LIRPFIPAVPFCHLTFSAARPILRQHERTKVPEGTLGAAFRARRWSRGLDQKQAAEEIGVSMKTYCGWETNRSEPDLRDIPAAIGFLGLDRKPEGDNLGARIHSARTAAGPSVAQTSSDGAASTRALPKARETKQS
jgi:DNA-binding XRE family transcriptional regulator